jgi:GxxExxY protein
MSRRPVSHGCTIRSRAKMSPLRCESVWHRKSDYGIPNVHHRGTKDTKVPSISITYEIVGAAIEVHRRLGPGLLESAYQRCLCEELRLRGIHSINQVPLPLRYGTLSLDCGYRLEMIVEGSIIVEVKAVSRVLPVHRAQVLTYLKLTGLRLGLLINFNVEMLRSGIYRIING